MTLLSDHQNLNTDISSPEKDRSQKKCKASMGAPAAALAPEELNIGKCM